MRVIIQDKFYEFQNKRTEEIFNEQKHYLANLVEACQKGNDEEHLLTALLSLNNLTEALIAQAVDEQGIDAVIGLLKATPL